MVPISMPADRAAGAFVPGSLMDAAGTPHQAAMNSFHFWTM
jgi:hypothetical protein